MDKRRIAKHLAIALLILALLAGPIAIALHVTVPIDSDVTFNASSTGPEVTFDQALNIESGKNPFEDANTINITSTQGNITFNSTGKTSTHITQIAGTYTNLSNIDTTAANLTVNPSDKNSSTIGGGITSYEYSTMSVEDGEHDLSYTADDTATIVVSPTNATPGTQYGLVKQSDGEGLDVAIANSQGTLTFDDVPAGTYDVEIDELGTLFIRNEKNSTQLIDDVNVTLEFFFETGENDIIVTRTAENGQVDMTGLPPDRDFVVVANASGWYNRRIWVPSLQENQDVFLLNESVTAGVQVFELRDFSGNYPTADTVMEIQRNIDEEWRTVEGDYFGAAGEFTATLELDTRHRLIIRNTETDDTTELGSYIPIGDERKIVRVTPDDIIEILDFGPGINIQPQFGVLPAQNNTNISATVSRRDTDLDSYTLTITYENQTTTQTLATLTGDNPSGETLEATVNLTNDHPGTVTARVDWALTDGSGGSTVQTYRITESWDNYSLLSILSGVTGYFTEPDLPLTLFALFTTIIGMTAAARIRMSSEQLGLVGIGILVAWTSLGWLSWTIVFTATVAWVTFTAFRRGLI